MESLKFLHAHDRPPDPMAKIPNSPVGVQFFISLFVTRSWSGINTLDHAVVPRFLILLTRPYSKIELAGCSGCQLLLHPEVHPYYKLSP